MNIISMLNTGFSYIVPLVVLLSLLIFVHELGHFLVAKWFNVKVEVFSLGFGPKILKFRNGETTYCLSAIPFGGYVKMFGEDINADMSLAEKERSFMHKPPLQRILIALAGPIMNLLFAILVFTLIGLIGEAQIEPSIGSVSKNSPALNFGFLMGDKILKVEDNEIENWQQFENHIAQNALKEINVTLMREDKIMQIRVKPELVTNENPISLDTKIGKIPGLSPYRDIAFMVFKRPLDFLPQMGLVTGDIVTELNGVKTNTLLDFVSELKKLGTQQKLSFSVQRENSKNEYETKKVEGLSPTDASWTTTFIEALDIAETYISEVAAKTPAEASGLKKLDKIQKINGVDIFSFEDIISQVGKFKETGTPLKIDFIRNFELNTIEITPNKTELTDAFGNKENRYTIGIRPLKGIYAPTFIWKPKGWVNVIKFGLDKTWEWTVMTVMSFVRLFQNKVSAKNLGGFISIGQMAQKSWEIGVAAFLKIMGIISINLFVLNLLPIPILDGGHIVIFTAEIINGKPLNSRKIEIAQQVGMFIILFLMVFTLFNDFSRILS